MAWGSRVGMEKISEHQCTLGLVPASGDASDDHDLLLSTAHTTIHNNISAATASASMPNAARVASALLATGGQPSSSSHPHVYRTQPLPSPSPAASAAALCSALEGAAAGGATASHRLSSFAAAGGGGWAEGGGASGAGGGGGGGGRTPESLLAGLARRLDSLAPVMSGGMGGGMMGGTGMPAWDAAARESARSRPTPLTPSLLAGRLGPNMVQRLGAVSKKGAGQGSVDYPICFRGFRVRCGMHSGLEEGRDVYWTKVSGRRAYSGPAMALAKTVSDLIPGGMVILTAATFDRLQPWPNHEALPGAIVWARGRFRVALGGEAGGGPALDVDVDVFQLLSPQLLARQPHLERRPWRGAEQVLPGVLSAPLGRLALVLVQVVGVQVLAAWNVEVTRAALRVFASVAAEALPHWGGYPARLDPEDGTLLAAFREPASGGAGRECGTRRAGREPRARRDTGMALGFAHALVELLRDAEWPEELLEHELGEALALAEPGLGLAGAPGAASGGTPVAFRGLRVRCVADLASVRVDLGCATAAALYETRDPKAFKSLRRMLARAHMGEVLCSGALVAEVLAGPPAALAALHELLAFAPLAAAGAGPSPMPVGASLSLSPLPTGASLSLLPTGASLSLLPTGASLSLLPAGASLSPLPAGAPPSPLPAGAPPSPLLAGASLSPLPSPHPMHQHAGPYGTSPSGGPPPPAARPATLVGFSGRPSSMVVAVNARLTGKDATRAMVYQCTRRRTIRRSQVGGVAGVALAGGAGGVYGSAAAGLYGGGGGSVSSMYGTVDGGGSMAHGAAAGGRGSMYGTAGGGGSMYGMSAGAGPQGAAGGGASLVYA
ncbi:hypothetical protein TSOC_007526 [Tetrabaena socialis]|uniref:Guanylate cyclase domain-containing protein n=1 Tax=Tetrabaena socialis TaxID=47790 RepID=A0A2J8A0U2_9CHLO|nr:hypothetical protein TSOC_007526 [Tetrabaena socialis]|eukprot:PNH06136.1 hypothetical protein TSOC_007526 [Tetrabaena socialis]